MPTPRKSLELHKLQGTKAHYDVGERVILEGGRPKVPRGLSKEARRVFRTLSHQLQERRQLTEADGEALKLYCQAYERHQQATKCLAEEGIVCLYTRLDHHGEAHQVEKPNLWLPIQEKAERFMLATLQQLGLTPQSRHKVKQLKDGGVEEIIPGSLADTNPELFEPGGKLREIYRKGN